MSPHVGPSWHQIGSKLAPSWPMLAQVDPSEPKLAPRWPQDAAKLAHVGSCWPEVGPCQERVSRRFESVASCNHESHIKNGHHESHIKNGHHESHIKHDDPLACDLWVVPIWCFCRVVSPCPFFQNDLFKRSPQVFQLMFLSCCFIFFVHCTKAL